MNNGYSRFIGALPAPDNSLNRACQWTSFQHLCPWENHIDNPLDGINKCQTILPALTWFECDTGYSPVAAGVCVQNRVREAQACSANFGGNRSPSIGNPVLFDSGAKIDTAQDFVTADGRLGLQRSYRSRPQATDVSAWRSPPRSALGGWQFDFSLEFHIAGAITSDGGPAGTIIAPDGTAFNFTRDGNNFVPTAFNPVGGYRLELVGTPPSSWSTIFATSSQWRVTETSGRVWILQTFIPDITSSSNFVIGRVVSITERDGYEKNFTYGSSGEVSTITDTFGRAIQLTWQYFNQTYPANASAAMPIPVGVQQAVFPDGTKVQYTYDVSPTPTVPSTAMPQKLLKAEWFNASSTVIDSVNYHYEDARFPSFLTGITDGRGIRNGTYVYNGQGRVTSTEGADGNNKYLISYSAPSILEAVRQVTNPLGKVATYRYDVDYGSFGSYLKTVNGIPSLNCPSSTRSYTYSGQFIATETDEEGRVTAYTRDAQGRPLTIVRGSGTAEASTTTYTWNTALNVPSQTVEPGLITDYGWTAGRLTSVTQTDTTTHTVPYSTSGQMRTWTYTYGTGGVLMSVDGPLAGSGDTVSYTYDSSGYVQTITNEVGLVTTVDSVNGRGQPTLVSEPNGIKTALTYDGRGRLLTTTADSTGTPSTTTIEYNGAGDITKITQPDGSWLSFTYDNARRLTTITNNVGETTNYGRDAMGGATSITRKRADTTTTFTRTQTFDELGRLLKAIGASTPFWQFGYDKTDNLTAVTDPRSNIYSYGFDALNRLISETNEESAKSQVTRNGIDAITSYKDPRNLTTSYVRNGFGDVIQASSPDSGTIVYQRDSRGLITQKTDGRSIVTNQTFDNAGRITARSFPSASGENVTWSYDDVTSGNKGKTRLTGMTDASGTTAWVYDARGNVLSETRVIAGKSYVVAYAYDLADKVTQITYPSGRTVTFNRDATGRVGAVSTKASPAAASVGLASGVTYQPFSDLRALNYGNALTLTRSFNGDDELSETKVEDPATSQAIMRRGLSRSDGLNLTGITVSDDIAPSASETFAYTAARRLQTATGVWGQLAYLYDSVGNRTQETLTLSGTTTDRVTAMEIASNRMATVTTNGTVSRTYGHDASGNIITDTQGSAAWSFTHYANGRLSLASVSGTTKGTYTYDGLERLAVRAVTGTTPSGTIHLIYDTAGHLLAEADAATGSTMREYVWLEIEDLGADSGPTRRPGNDNDRLGSGGQLGAAESDNDPTARAQLPSLNGPKRGIATRAVPLAVVADVNTASPNTLFVHADQLDRPVRMTDATKALVWDAVFLPFGAVQSIAGSASLDARFPGQWFQLETGLHYNWHRQYDPTTGRYLQTDPLGFVDGPSVYAYASSSPLMASDPEGTQLAPIIRGGTWLCGRNPACAAAMAAAAQQFINFCRRGSFGGGGAGGSRKDDTPDCKAEWEYAERVCRSELAKPRYNQSRGITGGHRTIEGCARGHVSERCGGNPIN